MIQSDVDRASQAHRQKVLASRVGTSGTARATSKQRAQIDRWATLNAFVDGTMSQCTAAEVRVWLVLYREVKPGGLARIGMGQISRVAGIERRSVVRALEVLKRRKFVEVVTRGTINGMPNAYRLLIPT